MKDTGPEAVPPPESFSRLDLRREKLLPVPEPYLKPFRAHQLQDAFHAVLDAVDETGRALRPRFHAHIEPDRRVEGHLLADQEMDKFMPEGGLGFGGGEIPAHAAPTRYRIRDPADQLLERILPIRAMAVEIFGGDDLSRRQGPGLREFHALLFEYDLALLILDDGIPALPFRILERVLAVGREVARDLQAGSRRSIRGGFLGHGLPR